MYQGKSYIIQNVTKQEARNSRGTRLIVEDTEIHSQVQEEETHRGIQEVEIPSEMQDTETTPEA